jgi:diacylglycerol kinase (ATP)
MTRALIIGNPKAGRGKGFGELRAALDASGLDYSVSETARPGHATEIASMAAGDGYGLVVAAGGDGTVHEVVNGLLATGPGGDAPVLGVVPLGSGCDYVKTFDIPQDVGAAVALLASDKPAITVDAGEVTYRTDNGEQKRYFANIAEAGIGPEVVDRASRMPRFLGPGMYLAAFLTTLPRFKQLNASIAIDAQTYTGPLTNLVVAIGRVFGGGMQITPKADPSDGYFDVQIHFGSKVDYVAGIPKVFKGTHIPHPRIREERATSVSVRCDPATLVEADGEVLGRTPATFRVIRDALRLKA